MTTRTVRVTQEQLRRVSYVEVCSSRLGGPAGRYAADAKQWIESELIVRDSVEVEEDAIRELIESCEMREQRATLQAVVDTLSVEFDATQEWVPEDVGFWAVVD